MTTLTKTLLSTFLECPIAPLEGVPTHTYMMEVNGFLNACTSSVHCNLGNGTVGYLVLTAQPASFQIASPTSFVKPVIPGVLVLGDPAPSAVVIGSLTCQHTEDTIVFNEDHSVDRACKKYLCALIPEAYFRSFKNKYTGYANVQCLEIMSHLWSTYGVLQDYEVQENDVKMKKAISDETLFEEFVEQIETAVDAVSTKVPYTRQQIVSISFIIVENAGIYYDGVKEWRQKYTADKTCEAFRTFFAREFIEIRFQPKTSASEGYGTTTNMRGGHANAAEFERQHQQAEALANLATVTAADRQVVADLSIRNSTLTHEFWTATATNATLQQRLASCECAPTPRTGKRDRNNAIKIQSANLRH